MGEVTYKAKQLGVQQKTAVFKPLEPMTMKMLADAVNHSKLKKQIAEEIKSEKSAAEEEKKGGAGNWRESSSEDLYSD